MLVVRSLRQDRVPYCVTSFIIKNLGPRFVEPPVLDMKAVSGSSHEPYIFANLRVTLFAQQKKQILPCIFFSFLSSGCGRVHLQDSSDLCSLSWGGPNCGSAAIGWNLWHEQTLPRALSGPRTGTYRQEHDWRGCQKWYKNVFSPIIHPKAKCDRHVYDYVSLFEALFISPWRSLGFSRQLPPVSLMDAWTGQAGGAVTSSRATLWLQTVAQLFTSPRVSYHHTAGWHQNDHWATKGKERPRRDVLGFISQPVRDFKFLPPTLSQWWIIVSQFQIWTISILHFCIFLQHPVLFWNAKLLNVQIYFFDKWIPTCFSA